ncbi:MAG TPA: hypothetical protein VHN18_10235 [Micromonosporaceae bacterium]|nr:hypothetical protein [Micromonosporaceae bacterium]
MLMLHRDKRAEDLHCGGQVPMWDSDRHFLPLVFAAQPRVFHGVMPFANGKGLSWSYTQL